MAERDLPLGHEFVACNHLDHDTRRCDVWVDDAEVGGQKRCGQPRTSHVPQPERAEPERCPHSVTIGLGLTCPVCTPTQPHPTPDPGICVTVGCGRPRFHMGACHWPEAGAADPEDRLPKIEPEGTIMGDWQKARTDAVSAMFDAGPDECGIYQTTRLYVALDNAFRAALEAVVMDRDLNWEAVIRTGMSGCGPEHPELHFHFGSRCLPTPPWIKTMTDYAVAEEREACAVLVEEKGDIEPIYQCDEIDGVSVPDYIGGMMRLAAAIRNRKGGSRE